MEYYIDKKEEDEYSDQFKRKFIMKWKGNEYLTYINSSYLDDKIISIDDLEDFFDSTFNKKKFYNFDCSYNFYFSTKNCIHLNILVDMKINDKLKSLKQDFIFILHKIDKRTWKQWLLDIIFDRD